ncbi:hypothetical protein SNE40_019172 [Patella caerulea]|uniref:BHLH domain-containing protein n=1 Tax=Patella caerulea TaxID=87958 RepID=A0AAN8J652_PATCE
MAGLLSTCESPCSPTPCVQLRGNLSTDSSSPDKLTSPTDTPRKNKRKLSEPRKRSDFSIKRFCPDSPGSAMSHSGSGSEDYEPIQEDPPDTPEPCHTFASDLDDSSQGLGPRDEVNHLSQFYKGVHANCIVPNLYYGKPNLAHNGLLPQLMDDGLVNGLKRGRLDKGSRSGVKNAPSIGEEADEESMMFSDSIGKRNRKNYKNMTRERRVEANARERSRVHTISAAFDSLRRAVPSYSYNQKLSKLAILRIASSYIMALSSLADEDAKPTTNFAECVDMCTQTIQTEGRARRRH